jgi:hypothetical protein
LTGRPSMPGRRRTSRCSSIRVTRRCASTRCAPPATSASNATASCSRSRDRRSWSLRPGCRPVTTSTGPRSTSIVSCPAPRSPRVRTRATQLDTGRCGPARTRSPTWHGPTSSQVGSCCRSRAWSLLRRTG